MFARDSRPLCEQCGCPRSGQILRNGSELLDQLVYFHMNKRTQYERPSSLMPVATKQPLLYEPQLATTSAVQNGHISGQLSGMHLNDGFTAAYGRVGMAATNGSAVGGHHEAYSANNWLNGRRNSAAAQFTRNPAELRGELLTTQIQKGPKGLGFTLIGNDGTNAHDEFIQIKTIIANGPAEEEGTLRTGDLLVFVNDKCMLGASQDDACQVFRAIPVGQLVRIHVCRGYPLQMDPTNRIFTENVYASSAQFSQRMRDHIEMDICKGPKGFGFTVYDDAFGQRVKSILQPDQCPNLLEGDTILEVDGRNVRALPHPQLVQMLHDFPVGHRCKMLIQRRAPKQRSRTPTAGFRYGYGGGPQPAEQPVQPRAGPIFAQRSKTPGPAQKQQRQSVHQAQLPAWHNGTGAVLGGSTTLPRSLHRQQQPTNGGGAHPLHAFTSTSVDAAGLAPNGRQMRASSSTLGFGTTAQTGYSATLHNGQNGGAAPQNGSTTLQHRQTLVVLNLNAQPSGFGFHLLGGAEEQKPLSVGAIIGGGAADVDGRLRVHDQIVEIDGHRVDGAEHNYAVELIRQAAVVGHVKLAVVRHFAPGQHSNDFGIQYQSPSSSVAPSSKGASDSGTAATLPYDVQLVKGEAESDFGCTIISHNHRYIAEIVAGSAAQRCGRLRVGDCVMAINGITASSLSHQQVLQFIQSAGNTLTLRIDPTQRMLDSAGGQQQMVPQQTSSPAANGGAGDCPVYGTVRSRQPANNAISQTGPYVFCVELTRGERGFGFSIRGGADWGTPIFIMKIAEVGPAAGTAMQIGDQIVEIDGESTAGISHQRAIEMIKERQRVRLTLGRR